MLSLLVSLWALLNALSCKAIVFYCGFFTPEFLTPSDQHLCCSSASSTLEWILSYTEITMGIANAGIMACHALFRVQCWLYQAPYLMATHRSTASSRLRVSGVIWVSLTRNRITLHAHSARRWKQAQLFSPKASIFLVEGLIVPTTQSVKKHMTRMFFSNLKEVEWCSMLKHIHSWIRFQNDTFARENKWLVMGTRLFP